MLSGIPVDELRKRKKQSKLALSAMREIQEQKQGRSFLWWLLGPGLFIFVIMLLIRVLFRARTKFNCPDVGGVRRTRRPSVRVLVPCARIGSRLASAMCPMAPLRRLRVQRAGEEIAAANPCPTLMLIYKQPITSGILRRCVHRRPESRSWV